MDFGGKPVEKAAAYSTEGGPQTDTVGEAKLSPPPLTTDNADFVVCHRIDGEPSIGCGQVSDLG